MSKSFPRIVNVNNKKSFIEVGKKLSELHLNYEEVPPYPDLNIEFNNDNPSYKVKKMKHPKIKDENGKNINDTSSIIFNTDIRIDNIPSRAYEYLVNGRSAISWIMDQYRIKNKSDDNPNEYSQDPKYIFNLLLSIINLSIQTVDVMNNLPPLEIIE